MAKAKVTVELDVDVSQELVSTLETMANKIDWVLINQSPRNPIQLEARRKMLDGAARLLKAALHKRAIEEQSKPTLKSVK